MLRYEFFEATFPFIYNYFLSSSPLEHIQNSNIHMYPFPNFGRYTIMAKEKALKVLGFIKRNAKAFSSAVHLRTLYGALVYCTGILEYDVIVWDLCSA